MVRPLKRRRCRSCNRYVLVGLDSDHCAVNATVDPKPLTSLGEALALLTGRNTYDLQAIPTQPQERTLERRSWWHILGRPAGTYHPAFPADVVTDHHCTQPLTDHTTDTVIPTPTAHHGGIDELPPF